LTALALGATACGGDSDDDSKSNGVTPKKDGALKAVVNPSDKKGGTLNYAHDSDFDSLDPARTYYAHSWNYQRIWQRTLLMFNPVPGEAGAQVVPDLATGKGEITDGGKTVTYKLRDGITFEDGTAITSKDVKYALERGFATDVITGGPGPTYIQPLLDPDKKYKGPYKDKNGLATILTPDDKTIQFKLAKPFADFDYLMALPLSTPVPQKKDTGARYQFHPVATGPYKIAKYQPGKLLQLVRNENWNAASDPNRKALPDAINLTMGLTPDDIDQRLLNGTVDLYIPGTGMQPTAVSRVLGNPTLAANSDNPLTGFTRYITIQQKVAPLDNVHCRRAVQYAADKVALQLARGGPIAGGDFAGNMAPPVLKAFKQFDEYPSGADHKGDLAKAREELQACGKPNGFKTKIATSNKGKGPKVATALQQGLARVGIQTEIVAVDSSTYYTGFIGVPDNVHKRGLGLAVAGWGPDFPTEYGFWESIVDGRAIKPAGNSNYAELNDPAINKLIDDALATTDASKAKTIWQDVDKKVMESAVLLPFVFDKALFYRNPRLTNVYFTDAFGMYDYVNVGIK
jgi:peptide/nickel transport system substrate-binding protein